MEKYLPWKPSLSPHKLVVQDNIHTKRARLSFWLRIATPGIYGLTNIIDIKKATEDLKSFSSPISSMHHSWSIHVTLKLPQLKEATTTKLQKVKQLIRNNYWKILTKKTHNHTHCSPTHFHLARFAAAERHEVRPHAHREAGAPRSGGALGGGRFGGWRPGALQRSAEAKSRSTKNVMIWSYQIISKKWDFELNIEATVVQMSPTWKQQSPKKAFLAGNGRKLFKVSWPLLFEKS